MHITCVVCGLGLWLRFIAVYLCAQPNTSTASEGQGSSDKVSGMTNKSKQPLDLRGRESCTQRFMYEQLLC